MSHHSKQDNRQVFRQTVLDKSQSHCSQRPTCNLQIEPRLQQLFQFYNFQVPINRKHNCGRTINLYWKSCIEIQKQTKCWRQTSRNLQIGVCVCAFVWSVDDVSSVVCACVLRSCIVLCVLVHVCVRYVSVCVCVCCLFRSRVVSTVLCLFVSVRVRVLCFFRVCFVMCQFVCLCVSSDCKLQSQRATYTCNSNLQLEAPYYYKQSAN